MRTNIVIDDALMAEAQAVTGSKTKRETVDLALRALIRLQRQAEIRRYKGRLEWQGDLDALRADAA
ncbi:type II toxin-antitoxin system VapB family antitoxin [Brevundimonas sp. VNH65]|uniref:type II toxin-antitoxin system VapB family antitoxin n=1 Tax=Brevundimonas sp. VNH65 TaxID=3400917 RepID=UPI003C0DE7B8